MSIASEIARIIQAKAGLKTALEAKGVTVPSGDTIDTYPDKIEAISGGGGVDWGLAITEAYPAGHTYAGNPRVIDFYGSVLPSRMFYNNSATVSAGSFSAMLETINFKNGLISVGDRAFFNCTNVVNINNFFELSPGMTSVSAYIFYSCRKLNFSNLPQNIKNIGAYAFYYCALTQFDCPGVEIVGDNAFRNCGYLNQITLGSVGSPVLEFGGTGVFMSCSNLQTINIYVTDPSNPPAAIANTAPWGAVSATINYLQA